METLTKSQAITNTPKLYWYNGILFSITEFGGEKIQIEQTKGIWYIDTFDYAECPDKIEIAKWNGYAIEVVDATGWSNVEELVKSIKEGIL